MHRHRSLSMPRYLSPNRSKKSFKCLRDVALNAFNPAKYPI